MVLLAFTGIWLPDGQSTKSIELHREKEEETYIFTFQKGTVKTSLL